MNEAVAAPKPRRIAFRSANSPKLTPDQARRQGQITHLAFSRLGGREAALAFLNEPNPALGERPLDLATASTEGFERVVREIGLQTPPTPENTP